MAGGCIAIAAAIATAAAPAELNIRLCIMNPLLWVKIDGRPAAWQARSGLCQPVLAHQFFGPTRLAHRLAREKLRHDRLDIEHRRFVNGIEFRDVELRALDPEH